jgi:hypothetical protein
VLIKLDNYKLAKISSDGQSQIFTNGIVIGAIIDRGTKSMKAELLIGKNDSDALPPHHTEFPNRPIRRI